MYDSWEPSAEAVFSARKEYSAMEKKYLDKFGKHSLDRVILGDPAWPNADDIKRCTRKLEDAIKNNMPIEQVPEEIWDNIVF